MASDPLRIICWAIVKDAKGMRATGHERAVTWARAYLGLTDRPTAVAIRHTADMTANETPAPAFKRRGRGSS